MPTTLPELLVKIQLIDDRQHDAALSRARSRSGPHVVQQIVEAGIATESTIARAISVELSVPRIDLAATPPDPEAVKILDSRTCTDRFVIPVSLRDNGEVLLLAMADPTDQDTIGIVQQRTGKKIRPGVSGPGEIQRAIRQCYDDVSLTDTHQPERPPEEKLAAMAQAALESNSIVELATPEDSSPLSRLAAQLGVGVPQDLPSRKLSKPPPKAVGPVKLGSEIFGTTSGGAIGKDDLQPEDLAILDALSQSMEKGALVLRALAELCVEKGLFTREEMRKKHGG